MGDEEPRAEIPAWDEALTDVAGLLDARTAASEAAEVRNRPFSRGWVIAAAVALLAVVLAWDAWVLTRPPELPPPETQAYALRRTAAALVDEALAILAAEGRLPSSMELADRLDEGLTYEVKGDGFVVTNTDGELLVRYDGSMPVGQWVVDGGYELTTGVTP